MSDGDAVDAHGRRAGVRFRRRGRGSTFALLGEPAGGLGRIARRSRRRFRPENRVPGTDAGPKRVGRRVLVRGRAAVVGAVASRPPLRPDAARVSEQRAGRQVHGMERARSPSVGRGLRPVAGPSRSRGHAQRGGVVEREKPVHPREVFYARGHDRRGRIRGGGRAVSASA